MLRRRNKQQKVCKHKPLEPKLSFKSLRVFEAGMCEAVFCQTILCQFRLTLVPKQASSTVSDIISSFLHKKNTRSSKQSTSQKAVKKKHWVTWFQCMQSVNKPAPMCKCSAIRLTDRVPIRRKLVPRRQRVPKRRKGEKGRPITRLLGLYAWCEPGLRLHRRAKSQTKEKGGIGWPLVPQLVPIRRKLEKLHGNTYQPPAPEAIPKRVASLLRALHIV